MKRKLKLALASACVVAAGFGGMKAYNAANQSETDLLLAENVEALSNDENTGSVSDCAGIPMYNTVGVFNGETIQVTHLGGSIDVKSHITYKECYAYGNGELSGFNGIIDWKITSAEQVKCTGNHTSFS
jgi:hypothetical protein